MQLAASSVHGSSFSSSTLLFPSAGQALRVQQHHPLRTQADGLVSIFLTFPPSALGRAFTAHLHVLGPLQAPFGSVAVLWVIPQVPTPGAGLGGLSLTTLGLPAGARVPAAGSAPWCWPGTGS